MSLNLKASHNNTKVVPKVLLHVGRHKTGTTSIQHFLSLNDELLASKYGVLYPETGRGQKHINHHPLFRDLVNNGTTLDPVVVRKIMKEADIRGRCHTVLLSSEMLGRNSISDDQLKKVRAAFSGHEIRIIIYFRRQDGFLQSVYAELIKRGLLKAPTTIHDLDPGLDYYVFANRYAAVFGKEALMIHSYELTKNRLLDDFLSILGIEPSEHFKMLKNRVNQRFPWRYLALIRHANQTKWTRKLAMHGFVSRSAVRFASIFPEFMDRPRPLSTEQRRLLINRYRNSNDQLARNFLDGDQPHLW